MQRMRSSKFVRRSVIGLCAAATLLGAGCEELALRALTAGLEAAAQQLQDDDGDISFGDWLSDELKDL